MLCARRAQVPATEARFVRRPRGTREEPGGAGSHAFAGVAHFSGGDDVEIVGQVIVRRPADVVFDFFADMVRLTEWAPEEFVSVTRDTPDPIGLRSRFAYVMKRARSKSTFEWETFERPTRLVWSGPRVDIGPGWVEMWGEYMFETVEGGTQVHARFRPKLGGAIRILAPVVKIRNTLVLGRQLKRARDLMERQA